MIKYTALHGNKCVVCVTHACCFRVQLPCPTLYRKQP